MGFFKSGAVAATLGVPYYKLIDLIRFSRIGAPEKDSSGDYLWTDEDVERARRVLAARRPRRQEESHFLQ
jgi:hypothetical protein